MCRGMCQLNDTHLGGGCWSTLPFHNVVHVAGDDVRDDRILDLHAVVHLLAGEHQLEARHGRYENNALPSRLQNIRDDELVEKNNDEN